MTVVGSIIPPNQKSFPGILPMKGVMPFVLVIKLTGKEQAPILYADLDFVVEPVFPSSEFQDLETQNNGRLLKRMKNLHAEFLKCDSPNL